MSLPSARFVAAGIWLRQESKAHFGLPGYAPEIIEVNCAKILAHFCTFWPPLGTPLGQSR